MSVITEVVPKRAYLKNRQKMAKRGRNLKKLDNAIDLIKQHRLKELKDLHPITKGKYAGNMDCHIEGDWVLIWRYEGDKLILVLVDTGDHQMLFGESIDFYDDNVNINYYYY